MGFRSAFKGTFGVLFALAAVCILGIGGCLIICGGLASVSSVDKAREAARQANEKRAAEEAANAAPAAVDTPASEPAN